MRKLFTRFFSLMFLLVTCCFTHVGYAITDCDLTITAGNIELVTDVDEICDGDYLVYKVVGLSPELYEFAFNYNPSNPSGQYTTDPEFSTPENSTFTLIVKEKETGCVSNSISINAPDVLPLATTAPGIQNALCNGDLGEITINWTGGAGNLEYYVVPTADFKLPIANLANYMKSTWQVGVPAGTYYVAVQNASGCADLNVASTWKMVTITQPGVMTIPAPFIAVVNNTCFGGAEGKYNVHNGVTGGTAPFKASIDGENWISMNSPNSDPAGYYEFTGLAAGDYTVTVKDKNGCTATRNFTITEPAKITFDIAIVDVACNGANNGQITVSNVKGGNGSYSYSLDGIDFSNTTGVFSGLAPTYYSLWVKDGNNCIVAYSNPNNSQNVIAVQSPAGITFDAKGTDPNCMGEKGLISVVAKVGGVVSSAVQYSFDNGATWGTASTKEVAPGTYEVMVRNTNGLCPVGPVSITIKDKTAVTATFPVEAIKSPTCPGGTDGRFVINATGGTGKYTYSVDGSGFYSNNIIFETEGVHKVIVKDANGCLSQEYEVTIPAVKINEIVLADKKDISCFGWNTGRIDINVASWAYDRTPKIWYSKNRADVYTKGTVLEDTTPLTAGTYYVGATDAFGCFFDVAKDGTPDVIEVKIIEADKLEITAALVTEQATCFGDPDGVIAITAFGGTAFGNGAHAQYWLSTSNIDVSLTDAADFSDFQSYNATTGISTTTVQALKGIYYVYVRDNNCTVTKWAAPIEVKGFDKVDIINPKASALTHNNCYGDNLGAIVVAPATGGSGSFVYTLQKYNGTWTDVVGYVDVASSTFSGLAAGTYKVFVEDTNGCEGDRTDNIVITEPVSPVSFTLTPTDITCYGANNGIVKITAQGGTPGTGGKYWFKIADQSWQEMTSPKNVVITAKGTYSIQVKDSKGCVAAVQNVTIGEPDAVTLALTKTDVTTACIATGDGTIAVEVDGGIEAGEYQVSLDEKTWVSTVAAKYTFTSLAAGAYTIYAMDDHGCINSSKITINQPVAISFTASVTANVLCNGSNEGAISVTGIAGGTAPYSVAIVGGLTKPAVNGAASFSGLVAGSYAVVVTDAKGCKFMKNGLEVTEPTKLVLAATKLNDIGCIVPGKFSLNVTGGTSPYKYYWAKSDPSTGHVLVGDMPAVGTKWSESNLAEVTEAGTYIIWAKDANGCMIGGEGNGTPVNEWRVKVTKPATDIVITANVTGAPLCNGDESATITVSAIGGMPVVAPAVKNYTITIGGVKVEGGVKTGLGAGKYAVVVTDEYGCSATKEVEIVEPAALTATLAKADGSFTCPGSVQGYIEVNADGGTGAYTYELWRDGAIFVKYQADNSFLVQINHVYQVKVKDANKCVATSNIVVIDRVLPIVATITETTCYDDNMASIVLTATGEPDRTFFVRYKLNTDAGYSEWKAFNGEIAIDNLVFANSTPEQNFYYFQVKDSKGCETEVFTKSFVPTQHPLQVTALQPDGELSASFAIIGGISPYSYQVGTGEIVNLPAKGNTFQIVKLQAPSTTVTVFDAHGCYVTKTFNVTPISVIAETQSQSNFANKFDVTLTFNRPVTIAAGDIVGGTFTPGTGTIFTVAMAGADLATVKLELKNTIADASGNKFAGATYEYVIGDNTAPALVAKTPTLEVALTNNHPTFKMTFNENVKLGEGGKLKVYKEGTTTSSLEIPVTAAMVNGKEVTVTYATLADLNTNTRYYVTLDGTALTDMAGNKFAGISDPAAWVFKTGAALSTGNEDLTKAANFKVYPNPFTDFVNVANASELSKIVVTNIAGQVVKEVVNPTQRIQLNELRPGAYFISLYDVDNVIINTAKIIKR